MGAAACGCGKRLSEIKEYCTCEKPDVADLEEQMRQLESRLFELEKKMKVDRI